MIFKIKPFRQSKIMLKIFLRIYVPIIILLILIFLVSLVTNIPLEIFTKDPAVIVGEKGVGSLVNFSINPFVSIISNLGILLWCASASICLFSFNFKESSKKIKKDRDCQFLKFFGILSLLLLLDDLFLFHESIAPKLFISQKVVYVGYLSAVLLGIVKFKKLILQTDWIIWCFAFLFFSLSILIDILEPFENSIFLEDGFKFLGIASWLSYFVSVSLQVAKNEYR